MVDYFIQEKNEITELKNIINKVKNTENFLNCSVKQSKKTYIKSKYKVLSQLLPQYFHQICQKIKILYPNPSHVKYMSLNDHEGEIVRTCGYLLDYIERRYFAKQEIKMHFLDFKNYKTLTKKILKGRNLEFLVARQDLSICKRELRSIHKEREQTQMKIDVVTHKILRMRIDSMNAYRYMGSTKRNSVLMNAIENIRDNGQINGIYGRLGDLGCIDHQYDIAVSTASPALDYIVVETTETAHRCIDFLKKKHLGVATFCTLNKQTHLIPLMKVLIII
jgi:hypothetical protein